MYRQQQLSKCHFYSIFTLSVFTCFMAIVLTILIGALDLSGFGDGAAISVNCTNSVYFLTKFSEIDTPLRTCLLTSLFSAVSSIILVMLLPQSLLKLCKDEAIYLTHAVKVALYLSCSVMILTAIVPAGYFLTLYHELPYCTSSSYNQGHILVLCIFAMILVIVGLILWILLLWYFAKEKTYEEKYKEITSQPTEPNDQDRYYKKAENQRKQPVRSAQYRKRPEEKRYVHEETKENIHQHEEKRPVAYTYSKEPQERTYQDPHSSNKHQSRIREEKPIYERKEPAYERKQSPYKQDPPYEDQPHQRKQYYEPKESRYDNYNSRPKDSNVRYTPQKGYAKQDNEAELVYHRKKRSPESSKYEDALYKESRQYLSKQGGRSILNSEQAIEQREARGSDYFRSGDPANQNRSPPSNKPVRQGMLLNYIRGKYAG